MVAPLFKEMSAELKLTQFNGTVGQVSAFTGDPSPELDAVWGEYSNGKAPQQTSAHPRCSDQEPVNFSSIPATEFEKMEGAHTAFKGSARLTPEYGGGYVGYLWFSHQMHVSASRVFPLRHLLYSGMGKADKKSQKCLDMIRKSTREPPAEFPVSNVGLLTERVRSPSGVL